MAVGWIAYDKEGKPLVYMINDFDKSESEAKLSEISFWMPLPNAPESFSGGRENEIPLFCKF
jgi:hypothetical protein